MNLEAWNAALHAVSDAMQEMRYADAGRQLEHLLDETNALHDQGAARLRPITLGLLGECMFQQGHAENALPFYELALEAARAIGDADAIAAYLDCRYEVFRYLGRGEEAAKCAEDLAMLLAMAGRDGDAKQLQRRAALARSGEPKNRVVATLEDGTTVELDDIEKVTGRVRFSFQRDRITLRRATALVEEGEALGASGKFEAALAKFREAAQIDPYFAHARYQEGFTLVLLRRYEEAVAAYTATEELAPGWFHCRADLWIARALAERRIEHATFEALRELEDGPGTPEAKLELADGAIATAPNVAGFYLARGRALAMLDRKAEAAAAMRDGLARDSDADIRTRLLVQLAIITDDASQRTKLFEEAVRTDGNLVASATARLALRQG